MAALNYYLGLTRAALDNPGLVTNGTASAGTGADVEIRIQMNNGTINSGITKKDVHRMVCTILQYIDSSGDARGGGAPAPNLPPL